MDNYLMLDGKKYELSPELANALRSCVEPEPEKKSPFEKELSREYYYITTSGDIEMTVDMNYGADRSRYSVANYCADDKFMEQRAMHETLNRLLWRYSEEHGGDKLWLGGINEHWVIFASDGDVKRIALNYFDSSKIFGVTYFCDEETAQAAIEEIVKPFLAAHPDFVW